MEFEVTICGVNLRMYPGAGREAHVCVQMCTRVYTQVPAPT